MERKIIIQDLPNEYIPIDEIDMDEGIILVKENEDIMGSVIFNYDSSEFEMYLMGNYDSDRDLSKIMSMYPEYDFIFKDSF
jgi:hypothetical protein